MKNKKRIFNFQFSNKNWQLQIEKFLLFFNFQFWIEIEIPKNVLFHSNFKMEIEWHFRCTDSNGHSFFNLKTKNELHVPKQPFFNIKIKNEKPILAVERFLLQLQKASSKTSFGLNKFYLTITSSLQILTLLSFIFRFSKWNWKTKIKIISFYGDLKSTDLLLNYWWIWAACWQYNKTHLSWNDQ